MTPLGENVSRYLFSIIDGRRQSYPISVDAPDLAAVRIQALRTACELVNDDPDTFWRAKEWQMLVTDECGLILFTLNLHVSEAPASMGRVIPLRAQEG